MKNIPMADRRLGRSIVITLSAALMAGYRNLQRQRQREAQRSSKRTAARKH